jgi:hypothetical protein
VEAPCQPAAWGEEIPAVSLSIHYLDAQRN